MRSKSQLGKLSQSKGKTFEKIAFNVLTANKWKIIQIPNSASMVNNIFIRKKTPFDFIGARDGAAVFFDTKITDKGTFPKSQITYHQADFLATLENESLKAGYIICFETSSEVYWFGGRQLLHLSRRSSLKPENGIYLGRIDSFNLDPIFETKPQEVRLVVHP